MTNHPSPTIGRYLPPTSVAPIAHLRVVAVQTPELAPINTGVIFAISGSNWAPHADVRISFTGLEGHGPDISRAGVTITANSNGTIAGLWGIDRASTMIGPTAEVQQVTASGPSVMHPASVAKSFAVIQWL